jgi:hypothetical protein
MEFLNEELAQTASQVETKSRAVPTILDGKFFVILTSEINGAVKAKCLTCANGKKSKNAIVSGRYQPSSNFTTHLKVNEFHDSLFIMLIINLFINHYKNAISTKCKLIC